MRIAFAITTSVVFTASLASASAAEFPSRRAGLWETTMHMDVAGMGPMTTKMCLDAATDAKMMKYGMTHQGAGADCTPPNISGIGGTRTMDIVCHMQGSTQKTHVLLTFAGDTYHTDITSTFDPPMNGRKGMHMTQDAKWAGACPADMKPGDMQMPGGFTINVMSGMNGGAPGGGGNPYAHLTPEQIQAIIKAHGGH